MKVVTVSGTYRKGKTIDRLIDKALEGFALMGDMEMEKIQLIDRKIDYCKNCLICKNSPPEGNLANCPIKDDMVEILPILDQADAYILATPVNIGHETAVTKTFLERICWVMAKPGDTFPVKGVPVPRNPKKRAAAYIISSGLVPPLFRVFCDSATPLFDSVCQSCLNAKVVGSLYAGDVETRGIEYYYQDALYLGKKLAKITKRLNRKD